MFFYNLSIKSKVIQWKICTLKWYKFDLEDYQYTFFFKPSYSKQNPKIAALLGYNNVLYRKRAVVSSNYNGH